MIESSSRVRVIDTNSSEVFREFEGSEEHGTQRLVIATYDPFNLAARQAAVQSVEIPIVIPRLDGHTLQPASSETVVASQPGSAGWNSVILELLSRLYSGSD